MSREQKAEWERLWANKSDYRAVVTLLKDYTGQDLDTWGKIRLFFTTNRHHQDTIILALSEESEHAENYSPLISKIKTRTPSRDPNGTLSKLLNFIESKTGSQIKALDNDDAGLGHVPGLTRQ